MRHHPARANLLAGPPPPAAVMMVPLSLLGAVQRDDTAAIAAAGAICVEKRNEPSATLSCPAPHAIESRRNRQWSITGTAGSIESGCDALNPCIRLRRAISLTSDQVEH